MEKVQILLSTYNGEKYLREQLDSILRQDCKERGCAEFCLLVRDDGSSDRTPEILEEYAKKYPERIMWYQGENIGVVASFLELVCRSDDHVSYYAFADQDDVWMEDKITSAVSALRQMPDHTQPNLYCCRPQIVDENLKEIFSKRERIRVRPGFGNALIENIVVGCTIMMNHFLRDMLVARPPHEIMMHDRWIYLLASCFGEIFYDESAHIYYRQHENNTVGMNDGVVKEFFGRLSQMRKKCRAISAQAVEFWRIYRTYCHENEGRIFDGNETIEKRLELAGNFVESRYRLRIRWALLKNNQLYRQRPLDHRMFQILFLLGFFR